MRWLGPLWAVLLCLACGARPASTGGDPVDAAGSGENLVTDGAQRGWPDAGLATTDLEVDSQGPDASIPGQVTVTTDRLAYTLSELAQVTVHNGTDAPIFLAGCSILTREHLQQGQWVDRGPDLICDWEGVAVRLEPGERAEQPASFDLPGSWRLAVPYGTGCKPGVPLSGVDCTGHDVARSLPVELSTDRATCDKVHQRYKAALENALQCDPAVNTPQCTTMILSDLICGCPIYVNDDRYPQRHRERWDELGCGLSYPSCDADCAIPPQATCVDGACVIQWQ